MTNKQKIILLKEYKNYIELLKEYKNYLLLLKEYWKQMEKEQVHQEEQQTLDKPKVLVLKRKFKGRDMVVA